MNDYVQLRRDLHDLCCEYGESSPLSAILLDRLLWWTTKLDEERDGWMYKTCEELADEVFAWSAEAIRRSLARMVKSGLLEREKKPRPATGGWSYWYRVPDRVRERVSPRASEDRKEPHPQNVDERKTSSTKRGRAHPRNVDEGPAHPQNVGPHPRNVDQPLIIQEQTQERGEAIAEVDMKSVEFNEPRPPTSPPSAIIDQACEIIADQFRYHGVDWVPTNEEIREEQWRTDCEEIARKVVRSKQTFRDDLVAYIDEKCTDLAARKIKRSKWHMYLKKDATSWSPGGSGRDSHKPSPQQEPAENPRIQLAAEKARQAAREVANA